MQLFVNNFSTTLAAPLTMGASSLELTSATGLPAITGGDYLLLTISDGYPETTWEVVKVTALSGTTATITKGQEGTSDQSWSAGALAGARFTKGSAEGLQSPAEALGDIIYGTGSGTEGRLAANATATPKYLQSVSGGAPTLEDVVQFTGVTTAGLTISTATAGRVALFGAGGKVTDDADLVSDGTNLGIGTSSPATGLHLATTSTGTPRGIMSSQHSDGNDGPRFVTRKSQGTPTAPTAVATGANLLRLMASGHDGTNYVDSAYILVNAAGTIGTNRVPSAMLFYTSSDAAPSVPTLAMTLDQAQNATFTGAVGIGTTPTTVKLYTYEPAVTASDVVIAQFYRQRRAADGIAGLTISNDGLGATGTTSLIATGTNSQNIFVGPASGTGLTITRVTGLATFSGSVTITTDAIIPTIYGSATTAGDLNLRGNSADLTTGEVKVLGTKAATTAGAGAFTCAGGAYFSGATVVVGGSTIYRTVGATSTDGLNLLEATAASAGNTVRWSPRLVSTSRVWDTAASQLFSFGQEVIPVSAASPTAKLSFSKSYAGAAYSEIASLSDTGLFSTIGGLSTSSTTASTTPASGSGIFAGGLGADHVETYVLSARARTDASIGSELITTTASRDFSSDSGEWSGTGWTVGSGVYTHVAGANAATLAGYAATAGAYYLITATIVTTTAGTLTFTYGGVATRPIGQTTGTLTAHQFVVLATGTGGLVVTPSAAWAGTIDDVSVKLVTTGVVTANFKNAAGTTHASIRTLSADSFGVGNAALNSATGSIVVGIGTSAGALSSGSNSVYCGYQSGLSGAGSYTSALGHQAGYQHVRANGTYVGYQSGYQNAGLAATFVGYQAGYQNTADNGTFNGSASGYQNTGANASGFGTNSMYTNTAVNSTGIGMNALYANVASTACALGMNALFQNSGVGSSAFGAYALAYNTGASNVQVGTYGLNGVNKIQLAKGAWAAATSGAAGTVEVGRNYRVAAVIGGVETELSQPVTGTGAAGAQYDHTGVPVYSGPKTCTARKIYRQNSTDRKWYLVGTIADNTTTTFTDTQPTATYGTVNTPPTNTIAIGNEAKPLKSNDLVFGNSSNQITDVYFGGIYHETAATAGVSVALRAMGGNGTDKDGGTLKLYSGASTGSATGSSIEFYTSTAGSTGTAENVGTKKMDIDGAGLVRAYNTLVLPKTSGMGIQVDPAAPTWAWADLTGFLRPDTGGANAPTLAAFRGGLVREFFYSATDKMDMAFHIPHDYVPGTDLFIHLHWAHNGTAISGSLVVDMTSTYAKRDSQAFPAEKTVTITYPTVNIATTPQWQHIVTEVAMTAETATATLWDRDDIEVDGIILMNMTVTTIPTITGGSTNEPCIFFADIHYQSTGIGTKQKASPFWT